METRKKILVAVAVSVLCAAGMADSAGKACDRWNVFTDHGLFDCDVRETGNGFAAEGNGIRVETGEEVGAAGVAHRRTVVRNVSNRPVVATCLLDVFRFGGGDFEVYTQANTWMNESRGAWQPLPVLQAEVRE